MDRYQQHIRNLGFNLRLDKLEEKLGSGSHNDILDYAFDLFTRIEDATACEEISIEQREALVGRLHVCVPDLV